MLLASCLFSLLVLKLPLSQPDEVEEWGKGKQQQQQQQCLLSGKQGGGREGGRDGLSSALFFVLPFSQQREGEGDRF